MPRYRVSLMVDESVIAIFTVWRASIVDAMAIPHGLLLLNDQDLLNRINRVVVVPEPPDGEEKPS